MCPEGSEAETGSFVDSAPAPHQVPSCFFPLCSPEPEQRDLFHSRSIISLFGTKMGTSEAIQWDIRMLFRSY